MFCLFPDVDGKDTPEKLLLEGASLAETSSPLAGPAMTIAKIAALNAAGSSAQPATTFAKSGQNAPEICARICVHRAVVPFVSVSV
jgi:hypothetical protein